MAPTAKAYDPASGDEIDVPEEQFAEAVASGAVGLDPGARVSVVLPDGQKGTVAANEAAQVFASGGRLYTSAEQDEDAKSGVEKAVETGKAALFGLLRGATLGGSDYFLTQAARKSDDFVNPFTGKTVTISRKESLEELSGNAESRKQILSDLKKHHQIASTGGEVAGAVLPLFFGGGALAPSSAVSAGGQMLERGASKLLAKAITESAARGFIGRAAARAAAGAVEGGILGASQLVSEDALGEAELNAENLLRHMGAGAVLGGAASAGMGAAIDAAEAAITKGLSVAKSKLGFGSVKEFLQEVEEDASLKQVLAQNRKHVRKLDTKGRLDEAGKWLRENEIVRGGDSLEEIGAKLDQKVEEIGKSVGDFYDQLDTATPPPISAKRIAERIRTEVAPDLEGTPALSGMHERVLAEADKFDGLGDTTWSFRDATQQKNAYEKLARWNAAQPVEAQEMAQQYRQIYRVINDEMEQQGEALAGKHLAEGAFEAFKKNKRDFGMAKDLADATKERLIRKEANRVVSPSDYGAGLSTAAGLLGHGAGVPGGFGAGAVVGAAHKYIRERGNTWIAEGARKLSRLSWLEKTAGEASKQVDDAVSGVIEAMRSGAQRAPSAAAMGAASVLDSVRFAAAPLSADRDKDPAGQRIAEIAALAANPQALADRLTRATAPISGAAPRHAAALASKAQKAAAFLHAKAPRNPRSPVGIGARPWSPSPAERAKFARYVAAVNDPMSVIEEIRSGTASREGVEALREVYPKIHERVIKKLAEELAEDGDRLSYRDRVQLSILFGAPLDESMRPGFIAAIQQAYAAGAPQPGQGGGGVRLSALDDLRQSQAAMTPTQRVMAGKGQ